MKFMSTPTSNHWVILGQILCHLEGAPAAVCSILTTYVFQMQNGVLKLPGGQEDTGLAGDGVVEKVKSSGSPPI